MVNQQGDPVSESSNFGPWIQVTRRGRKVNKNENIEGKVAFLRSIKLILLCNHSLQIWEVHMASQRTLGVWLILMSLKACKDVIMIIM